MKMKRKLDSFIVAAALCCMLVIALLAAPVYAEEQVRTSGTCGKNVTFHLAENGMLTISGTGEMREQWRYSTVPKTLQSITSVVVEDGVTSISKEAFRGCTKLINASLPKGITKIGDYAFEGCYLLNSISIPEGVKIIGDHAFDNCPVLADVSIPAGVTYIGDYAFSSNKFTRVSIPEGVTYIGTGAFKNATIPELSIPSTVTEIGDDAFDSKKIKEIAVSDKNSHYCAMDGILYTKDLSILIKAPITIQNYVIPKSVSTISNYAFCDCNNLKSISIPSSVTSIGDYVFSGCTKLSEIAIPGGVTSIGDYAFYNCIKLEQIPVPDNLTSIGVSAFKNTAYYNNPDNWENGALYLSHYLIGGKDAGYYKVKEGTTVIGGTIFNENVTGLSLPDSLITISGAAFSGCKGLEKLIIPNSVVTIGKSVFSGCTGLTEIIIPGSVTTIDENAFSGCTGLTEIIVPESVVTIGEGAFRNCKGLEKLTIPSSVTLGKEALYLGKKNKATLTIVGGSYRTEWDLAVNPVYFKEIKCERAALNYNLADNTDSKVHYAKNHVIDVDSVEYDTYSDITGYKVFSETDKLQEVKDSKGNKFAFYGDKDQVIVAPEDAKGTVIKIENTGFTFGAATIGDDGYYYILWGKSISDDVIENSMDEENIQICKYDSSGRLMKTLGLPVGYTKAQFPFSSANANISYNRGFLCVLYSTRWLVSPSGLHHQGSEFVGINAETMELVNFHELEVSHEFGISMIPTEYGFAAIQRGDDSPRGICIGRYYLADDTIELIKSFSIDKILLYHSSGKYGTNAQHLDGNATYVYMGGLAMSNSTYAIAGKSEHVYTSDIYKDSGLGNGIYDVFVHIEDKSLIKENHSEFAGTTRINEATGKDADYNIIWLTECNEKEKAANVKIVTLSDGSYCVLWEKMIDGKFDSIRYVILDECGHTLRKETAIYNARLSCTSIQPIVEGNLLSWAVADQKEKTIIWYSVDLDKQELYDENRNQSKNESKDESKNENKNESEGESGNENTDNRTELPEGEKGDSSDTIENNSNVMGNESSKRKPKKKKTLKIISVKTKTKGSKLLKVSGKVSVKGATVKVEVIGQKFKKARVKGKKFTFKVSPKVNKYVTFRVRASKPGYKTITRIY